jgi:hypothetical protein
MPAEARVGDLRGRRKAESFEGRDRMLWSGTALARPGLRWFVRGVAVLVGLVSMVGAV